MNEEMKMGVRVLTCVYCGHEYPQETHAWGNAVLTEHIRVCPKHPMRKAEADIALLRGALAGLVGASDKAELDQMELAIRLMPAPAADKAASLDAIHALLATLPNNTICVKDGAESFPYEAVLHLARSSCHCQRSGPDVDANAHLECCMVGRAQAYLGMHVTPLSLYREKETRKRKKGVK